jgi:2-polyprenyl-3-methyl-5-hydroxy-6-metoxy-1,4-benzoquinol methylase
MDRDGGADKVHAPNRDPTYHPAMRAWIPNSTPTSLATGALVWALILPSGCAASTSDSRAPVDESARREDPANEHENRATTQAPADALISVRPGVNDPYYEDGAIETWTDRLERERREVIAARDEIVAALELRPGMDVADIGAGTGAFMAAISAQLGDGTLYAVDIVPQFITHLEQRAAAEGLANVVVVTATDTETKLPEASVDLLFICDVYHHFEYPSVYLRSLYETLKPEGRMVIVEFDKVPGKTSEAMLKHVRQDKATLLAEVTAEGFVLEREVTSVELEENYMLVFHK